MRLKLNGSQIQWLLDAAREVRWVARGGHKTFAKNIAKKMVDEPTARRFRFHLQQLADFAEQFSCLEVHVEVSQPDDTPA